MFFSLPFNVIDEDKPSGNGKKPASENKRSKPEDKTSANRKELANINNKEPDNKPNANIESLVKKIYQLRWQY